MIDWNDLPPDQQRQELARQMEHLRGHHFTALSNSVEALAQARELLAVPIYDPSRLEVKRASEGPAAADLAH